jgi:RNA polymerase sigma-70 factor (ECF subfamily)
VTAAVADILTFVDSNEQPCAGSREEPRVRALVRAARGGNRDAFGELIALYERVVFRTALAALGAPEDAEDAAQDALVTAWQKLERFRGEATFRTWLLTIVWRKALDRRRVRRLWWSRTAWPRGDDERDPLEELAGLHPNPEQDAVSHDLARRIRIEIARLSPKLKDAFLLASSGEHTYAEIAVLLRIPLGTVKWRVVEARRLIAKRLRAGKAVSLRHV